MLVPSQIFVAQGKDKTPLILLTVYPKPLTGSLFVKLQDVVMGYKHVNDLENEDRNIPDEERVRNDEKSDLVASGHSPSVVPETKKDSRDLRSSHSF